MNTLFEFLEKEGKVVLSEDAKKKISDTIFAIQKEKDAKIDELKSVLKESVIEIKALRTTRLQEAKKEIELSESKMIDKMSRYLDIKLKDMVPQHLVEAQAKLEVLEPLVESIKDTFSKNGIAIDNKGFGLLKLAKNEIETLNKKLDSEMSNRIQITEATEKLLGRYLVLEKSKGLTPVQEKRILKIFENSTFEEVDAKFDSIRDLVINEEKAPKKTDVSTTSRKRVVNEVEEISPEVGDKLSKLEEEWRQALN